MTEFQHQHTAHCETGVMSTMLKHHGLDVSEAMVFGLSSGIAFAYFPFIKLNGLPLIAYRMPPRAIIKGLKKRLGLNVSFEKFTSPQKGMVALDKQLNAGNIVGLQTSVFWLPYFPDDMRFHFNAHNLIVYAKKGDNYLISDPVFEETVICPAKDLQKARFAKGALAPKGMMYYLNEKPENIHYNKAIPSAIKASVRSLTPPVPIVGIKGIHFLANKLKRLAKAMPDEKQQRLFLGHIVRMQEEIGTGGAGFRYIYASFLQEAATLTNNKLLEKASDMMTDVGDEWRNFALHTVKMCKNRSPFDEQKLADLLHTCAAEELKVWQLLKKI
ncbi:MAG: BtrH N-terminal domain-containing protein [Gammaproteobacteria bacterium]|nr:BtrH N-terminal domain-containing protein [Gammaproteobacteria bacterium]